MIPSALQTVIDDNLNLDGPDDRITAARVKTAVQSVAGYAANQFDDLSEFPDVGVIGVRYIALDTGTPYYWNGTGYIEFNFEAYINAQPLYADNAAAFAALGPGKIYKTNSGAGLGLTYEEAANPILFTRGVNGFDIDDFEVSDPTYFGVDNDGNLLFDNLTGVGGQICTVILKKGAGRFKHNCERYTWKGKMIIGHVQASYGAYVSLEIMMAAAETMKMVFRPNGDDRLNRVVTHCNKQINQDVPPAYTPDVSEMTFEITRDLDVMTYKVAIDGQEFTQTCTMTPTGVDPFKFPPSMMYPQFNFSFGRYRITELSFETPDVGAEYMVVGDSITQAYDADTYAEAWAQQLKGLRDGVVVFAGRGSYTDDILDALPVIIAMKPKRVPLMIGINDILNGAGRAHAETKLASIISGLTAADIEVILQSTTAYNSSDIPTYRANIFAANPSLTKIDAYTFSKDPSLNQLKAIYGGNVLHPTQQFQDDYAVYVDAQLG